MPLIVRRAEIEVSEETPAVRAEGPEAPEPEPERDFAAVQHERALQRARAERLSVD